MSQNIWESETFYSDFAFSQRLTAWNTGTSAFPTARKTFGWNIQKLSWKHFRTAWVRFHCFLDINKETYWTRRKKNGFALHGVPKIRRKNITDRIHGFNFSFMVDKPTLKIITASLTRNMIGFSGYHVSSAFKYKWHYRRPLIMAEKTVFAKDV